jgi:hypothetical protein
MTRIYTRKTPEERFWKKVEKTSTCWNWIGGKKGGGYGEFGLNYKMVGAHKFSYELHKGKISNGKFVLHTCDNPGCVNPEHLFLGTQTDNMSDCVRKNRLNHFGGMKILTKEQIKNIKKLYSMREYKFSRINSTRALAIAFSVSRTTIRKALKIKS